MKFSDTPCFCFMFVILIVFISGCSEQSDTNITNSNEEKGLEQQSSNTPDAIATQNNPTNISTKTNSTILLARKYACLNCHAIDKKLVGPAWQDIAARYSNDTNATQQLFNSISKGSKGRWANQGIKLAMPPHSYIKDEEITQLVTYILSLKE